MQPRIGLWIAGLEGLGTDMFLRNDNRIPHLGLDHIDDRWRLEHLPSLGAEEITRFRLYSEIGAPSKLYFGPESDRTWFNGQRLHLRSSQARHATVWILSEIRPIWEPEFLISPLISPESTGDWTNVRTSEGSRKDGQANMVTDDVDHLVVLIQRLTARKAPPGSLDWQSATAASTSLPSDSHLLEFSSWSRTSGTVNNLTLRTYLGLMNPSTTTILDVSAGFRSPEISRNIADSNPASSGGSPAIAYSESTPSYTNLYTLVSQRNDTSGLIYIFIIRPGTIFTKRGMVTSHPHKWICQIEGDLTSFSISSFGLRRIGQGDNIPQNYIWSDKGVDAQFRNRENLPNQHIAYLGHGLRTKIWSYFGCLANGLMHMHANGIRHRDIKPRNILATLMGLYMPTLALPENFRTRWEAPLPVLRQRRMNIAPRK